MYETPQQHETTLHLLFPNVPIQEAIRSDTKAAGKSMPQDPCRIGACHKSFVVGFDVTSRR